MLKWGFAFNARLTGLTGPAVWLGRLSFIDFHQLPTGSGSITTLMTTFVISIGFDPTSSDFLRLNKLRLTSAYRAFTSFGKPSET